MAEPIDQPEPENMPPPSFSEVLKNRDFVKILVGQFFSNTGDAVLRVAILLYVYSFTGSLSITTIILSAQIIPWVVVGPIAGVFADRISRKGIMVSADITRAIAVFFIPFTTNIYLLTLISFVLGIAAASFTAPRSAAIPEITGMRLFVKGISLSQLVFQTLSVIGPLVGAFVFAAFGPDTFWISSVGYGFSALVISLTRIPNAKRASNDMTVAVIFEDLKEGIDFLFSHPVTQMILVLFAFLIFATAYASPLIYPYIYNIIHGGVKSMEQLSQQQYGIIGAVTAAGSILGNLVFGKFEKQIGRAVALFFGGLFMGFYFIFFLIQPDLQLLEIATFIFGFFNGMMSLSINAIFAEAVPNKIRGRAYSATNAYLQIFTALCTALSGITADSFGIIQTIAGVGLLVTVAVLVFSIKTKYRFLEHTTDLADLEIIT